MGPEIIAALITGWLALLGVILQRTGNGSGPLSKQITRECDQLRLDIRDVGERIDRHEDRYH